ncbi:Protein of unknown function [Sphingomonas sp. YR710]|uniref:glycosyltransferase family 61 protein n=1 Tax=Sphingomonas sp. YR710 TaxID=1882773 RepID=UPI0008920896|nr:glycosyltransferase family 61 protein [Sphingomonas sp. YR710]SDC49365.1 Protein of unknown function [Sphingomonas sp. YR710]
MKRVNRLDKENLIDFDQVVDWPKLLGSLDDSLLILPERPLANLSKPRNWSDVKEWLGRDAFTSKLDPYCDALGRDRSYCLSLKNAILLPPAILLTEREAIIPDTLLRYASLPHGIIEDDKCELKLVSEMSDPIVIDRPAIYVEMLWGHFGHALVEGLARLWPLAAECPIDPKDYLFVGFGRGIRHSHAPKWLVSMFAELGIDFDKQVIFVDRPMQFKQLIVPKRLSPILSRPGIEADDLFIHLGRKIGSRSKIEDGPKKIFLSRSALPLEMRGLPSSQGERLDRLFESMQYTVVHPQKLSLPDQVALVRGAQYIVGCAGSQLHLSVFCERATPLLKIATTKFNLVTDSRLYWVKGGTIDEYVVPSPPLIKGNKGSKEGWVLRESDFDALPEAIVAWESLNAARTLD